MKRTAILATWLMTIFAAYQAGRLASVDIPDPSTPIPPAGSGAVDPVEPPVRAPEGAGNGVGSVTERAAALAERGDLDSAIGLLETHLSSQSHDAEALFMLSDLRQMIGEPDRALDPLFDILRYPLTSADAEKARRRLNLLINAREQQLVNTGDIAGLIAYFQHLVDSEPGFDGHRLKLARWLARDGRLDEASRLLKEVGQVGVTDAEIAALTREVALARSTVPVERAHGALYAPALVRGTGNESERRFLIDTGATMTGLKIAILESIGAKRLEESTSVHTANGVTSMPVYRIEVLRLGPLVVEDLRVLGLQDLPRGADGLLGMDVLDRLSGQGIPAVGRP
jgi:predicted aspartyl protease